MSCYNYLCDKNNSGQIQSIGIFDIDNIHNNTEAFHFLFYVFHILHFFKPQLLV